MLNCSKNDILKLLSLEEIIGSVKKGLIRYAEGKITVPQRMHIEQESNAYLLMPALGEKYYCTKLVNVCPDNKERGIPVIQGSVNLFDKTSGVSLASFDAAIITALRTGAVGAIGLEQIAQRKISRIGIIGTGEQAIYQVLFSNELFDIEKFYCFNRSPEKFKVWKEKTHSMNSEITLEECNTSEEVVKNSDAIICASSSSTPVFNAENLDIADKYFVSLGSFRKDMQELPDEIYLDADGIILDSMHAIEEVGDVINALENGFVESSELISLGKILSGNKNLDENKKYVYKSVGMAALDYALCTSIYEASLKNKKYEKDI